jgi:tRNA modification GTPase
MLAGDTIVAISSAVGVAARMIVRMSGPEAMRIARSALDEALPDSAGARQLRLRIRTDLSFPAWVYIFRAPRSQTAEDIVEFHLPGNPLLARFLLDDLIRAGARQAEPGEFSARAYFNGKLDLAQAEGVAATIAATNETELAAARQLMAGELARRVRPVMEAVAEALALVEAGIDFVDEGVTFIPKQQLDERLKLTDRDIERILRESARFERLSHEPTVVLVGPPNAGKSTLLNALAGRERAIVSRVAGTTRDAISADVQLRRGTVRVIDIAGLELEQPENSDTPEEADIRRQMRHRAIQMAESADMLVAVRDGSVADEARGFSREPHLLVHTKSDLAAAPNPSRAALLVSAHTGAGMTELRSRLDELVFGSGAGGVTLALNARHVAALEAARRSLQLAIESNHREDGIELIAHELRSALDELGTILGAVTPDDVLGRVFATFCIGK